MKFDRPKHTLLAALIALASVMAFGGVSTAQAQEVVRVAIPQRGAWDTGVAELGKRGGIFKKYGLDVETLFVGGGAEAQQAIVAGSIDVAVGVGVSGAVGAYGKGAPLRIIGSEMVGAADLFWFVKPDSPVQSVKDFNGKTLAYSVAGSSSHAGALELVRQNNLDVKLISTGGVTPTFTSTVTGQVDIGWGTAPFSLAQVEDGKVRIVALGNDVKALASRTVRVNITSVDMLEKRKATIDRFMAAYRETIDWMYANPEALKYYAEFSGLPDKVVKMTVTFIPKTSLDPDAIVGMDEIVADAVKQRFLAQALTKAQIDEMVKIPARPKS